MATTPTVYGAYTGLTITLTSLANTSARQSTPRDNVSSGSLDDHLGGRIVPGATVTAGGVVNIYILALTDNGVNYAAGASGTDAAFTLPTYKGNMRLAVVVPINTASTAELFEPFSVANLFGGILPKKYVVVVENQTGGALDATSGGTISFLPITLQTV
jgi:hypothetical protein